MNILRNKGYVIRTINGYVGKLSIDGVVIDIVCTFWSDKKPNYIWVQRVKEKRYDDKNRCFIDYVPKPVFECYANKTKKGDIMTYRGEFMFVGGFKYDLCAFWEDRDDKQLNFEVRRSTSQPILKRLNELNRESTNK